MLDWRLIRSASTAGLLLVVGTCFLRAQQPPELIKHLQAAQADLDSEKYKEAAEELRAAVAIQPQLRGAYYQLGFALFQLHELQAAEKAFTKELDFKPPDSYSLYYLARIQADWNHPAQAISFFEKSLEAGDVLDGRERLGAAYLAAGRLDNAIRLLQAGIRSRPENGSLHYLLARAYKQKGRTAEAKSEFDAAARWKAKFRDDMASLLDLHQALAHKDNAAGSSQLEKLFKSNDTDILMACATALGQAGLHQQAATFLLKTLDLNAKIPEAHYDLARAYVALDNRSSALPELEKAVSLKPGFYEAQLLLGTLLADEGDAEAAISHLRQAVQVRADNPKLLMMLGLQYYDKGYFADAIDVLKKAATLTPDSPNPRYLLIEAYYRNFEYERALNLALETANRFPDVPMSHVHYGAQLNNMGRLPEAKQQIDMALAKDPELIEARVILGDILFKTGKAEESVTCFRTVLATDPKLMDAQAGLGKALIQLKRYPEAADAMEQAVKIDPNLAPLHLYLSQAYRAMSRPEDAKKEAALFSRLNQQRALARDKEGDRKYAQ